MKEVIGNIEKELQPALVDLSDGAETMIKRGLPRTGKEILENVGYIKGVLYKQLQALSKIIEEEPSHT